jgi:Homeodomain-like domain
VPSTTLLEMPPEEQAQMRAILHRARYGYLLAFHILLLCVVGRNPTEIAAFLFCSRSSVYRIVRTYRTGSLGISVDQEGQLSIAGQTTVLMPWLTRSLGALLKAAPRAYGWCRTHGVMLHSRRRSRPNTASRCRRKRYDAGSTR